MHHTSSVHHLSLPLPITPSSLFRTNSTTKTRQWQDEATRDASSAPPSPPPHLFLPRQRPPLPSPPRVRASRAGRARHPPRATVPGATASAPTGPAAGDEAGPPAMCGLSSGGEARPFALSQILKPSSSFLLVPMPISLPFLLFARSFVADRKQGGGGTETGVPPRAGDCERHRTELAENCPAPYDDGDGAVQKTHTSSTCM